MRLAVGVNHRLSKRHRIPFLSHCSNCLSAHARRMRSLLSISKTAAPRRDNHTTGGLNRNLVYVLSALGKVRIPHSKILR